MPYYFWGIDYTYIIFVVPALILAMIAQAKVSSTFKKYQRVGNHRNYTGAEVARQILNMNGLHNVSIERISGNLTDHYDPRSNVVRLSESTYDSTSVGAIGVAAHEVGHAVQHATGYMPIKLRNTIVPLAQISSYAAWPLAIFGIVLGFPGLTNIGIILFTIVVAFHIITLPVELNASRRAVVTLENQGILEGSELQGARKVLTAAAMTYVASAAVAIANLLRLLALSNRRR